MKLRFLVAALALAATCPAQSPPYYKTVNRVTWVVENIDKVRAAWEKLGLTEIKEYPNIQFVGQFRGKPVTIYAWQITGRIGNLTVDMIQPGEGNADAYTRFLSKHGDGILSVVYEVRSKQDLEKEILRMRGKGVAVLQQVERDRTTYTYFDTEPDGKFVLGLVYRPGGMPAAASKVSPIVWDASLEAYWEKLGFTGFPVRHAPSRADKPLSLVSPDVMKASAAPGGVSVELR